MASTHSTKRLAQLATLQPALTATTRLARQAAHSPRRLPEAVTEVPHSLAPDLRRHRRLLQQQTAHLAGRLRASPTSFLSTAAWLRPSAAASGTSQPRSAGTPCPTPDPPRTAACDFGPPKAITATAHKLARIIANLVRYGMASMKRSTPRRRGNGRRSRCLAARRSWVTSWSATPNPRRVTTRRHCLWRSRPSGTRPVGWERKGKQVRTKRLLRAKHAHDLQASCPQPAPTEKHARNLRLPLGFNAQGTSWGGGTHPHCLSLSSFAFFMITRTQPEPAFPENSVGRPFPVLSWQYFQVSPSNL